MPVITENTLLTIDMVAKKVLARTANSLAMVHTANRDYQNAWTDGTIYPIGSKLRVREPVFVEVGSGAAPATQGIKENYTDLVVEFQKNVCVPFTSIEEQRKFSNGYENLYLPVASQLANAIDMDGVSYMKRTCNRAVGSPGAGISSFATPNSAVTMQRKYGVQRSEYMVFCPDAAGGLRSSLQNSFNVPFNEDISQDMIIGSIGQHDLYEDQNLNSPHTTGTAAGTAVVAGAGQSGSEIDLSGFTASQTGVLKAGDIITFAGVYGVNPVNGEQVGYGSGNLAQFNVQQDVDSDGAGLATVQIKPAIVLTGPYKNVTGAPANGAAVSVLGVVTPGTATQFQKNFVYSRDALTFVCVPPPISLGAVYSKVFYDEDTGIGMRVNITYDNSTDQDVIRFDVFYGWQAFGPYMTMIAS